jgi:hypothetical protein
MRGLVALGVLCATSAPAQAPLAASVSDGAWRSLWRPSSDPPARWLRADSALIAALRWNAGRSGIAWAEIPLRGDGEAWRTRGIIVRVDPRRVSFALDTAFQYRRERDGSFTRAPRWRSGEATRSTLLALNAGQFEPTIYGVAPWGWTVLRGREWQSPGVGPLSTGIAFDSSGAVRFLPPSGLSPPQRLSGVAWAFQSFPTLLEGDGDVPSALRDTKSGVDLTHRDARLAIGLLRDGSVLVVMTRFDVFGKTMGAVPFGLTTPEMAALMGALGCQRAVMLDGGISAQMQLQTATGAIERWPGWRRVPMGLIARSR